MMITVPKQRDSVKWENNKIQIQKKVQLYTRDITFRQYFQFCELFLDAPHDVFKDQKFISQVKLLTKPTITFKKSEESSWADAVEQGKKIINVVSYAWDNICRLIEQKDLKKPDSFGLYTDENINLNFARLEEMVHQVKSKKYRFEVFAKEYQLNRQMEEKEMDEELVFVKLLESILITQMNKIKESRNTYRPQIDQIGHTPLKLKPKIDIRVQVKVEDYFKKKIAESKSSAQSLEDAIDRQQQHRRFNAAVLRFHLQASSQE